ncbi:MAG: FHA domain-containing protein [Planctomycetota bacterium]|jgi:hypothetical protein
MHLTLLATFGLMVATAAVSSGLTLAVATYSRGVLGLGIAMIGALIGGGLMFIGRSSSQAVAAPAGPLPGFEPAVRKPPPPAARGPRVGVKAQRFANQPSDAGPVGFSGEETIAREFRPDHQAHAVVGLGEIYQQMSEPGVYGCMLVVAGPDRAISMPITQHPIHIGRSEACNFRLQDATSSNNQASIFVHEGEVLIRDNGSKNGTFVNNQKVSQQPLGNCDVIAFGATKILVTVAG